MSTQQKNTGCVTIIGTKRREFMELLQALTQLSPARQINSFTHIEEAINDHNDVLKNSGLVIVLQSWTDQYARRSIDALIGATLFGRLLCCYGPWCESDGRNRDLWPDAVRIPARLAPSLISRELSDSMIGRPTVPPTAARDEVFTHRLGITDHWQPLAASHQGPQQRPTADQHSATSAATATTATLPTNIINAAIVGPDRVFRRTLAMGLSDLGIRSLHIPLLHIPAGHATPIKETSRGPVHVVFHDLDPWGPAVEDSLLNAQRTFPSAVILGVATMPDAGLTAELVESRLNTVIPKLDLELGLRWHLKIWLTSKSHTVTAT